MSRYAAQTKVRARQPGSLWSAPASPIHYGRESFRFRLLRSARHLPDLDINPWVESVQWQRAGAFRSGTLGLRRPLGPYKASLVQHGDIVRCDVDPQSTGQWMTLWRQEVSVPNHDVMPGTLSLTLAAANQRPAQSKVTWKFTTHNRPGGWTAAQITEFAGHRFGLPVGTLPACHYRISTLVEKSASVIDVITRAWILEREHTGRQFDIDLSSGVIVVTEVREPRYMLHVGAALIDALLSQTLTGIATEVIATGTARQLARTKTGKITHKTHKLRVQVTDAARQGQYGTIVKTLHAPAGINTVTALQTWARQQLAWKLNPKNNVQLTLPGLPFMDRGDAVRVTLPEADLDELVYIIDCTHTVSAGSYQTTADVGLTSPWKDLKTAASTAAKGAKAAKRGRKSTAKHTVTKTPAKAPVRAKAHA